jgi:PhnB protein
MAKPIPDAYPRVMPYLIVDGAGAAIDFYCSVLGARERMRMPAPGDRVGHAELEIGDSVIMLADEAPDHGAVAPPADGTRHLTLHAYVPDVDGAMQMAERAGAKVLLAAETRFYGDRGGSFLDPFGHIWHVASHVEDVPEAELRRRAAAAASG